MTEKRFELNEDTEWWFVKDNTIKVNEFGYRDDVSGEDKYRGLKQDLTEQEVVDLLNELVEDNEYLKQENYELHKRLGDFEQFERYMKERTSKTSVNDIIGLVKTDEPTNSVELKKELYK